MATTWGAFVDHMRVGLDIRPSGSGSVDIFVDVWVQCEGNWNFNDSQHVSLSGSSSGSWDFSNNLAANQTQKIATVVLADRTQTIGGGPTYSWTATLTGNYLGGTASHSRSYTLPALPISPPAPPSPGPVWSAVTATSATVDWGNSPDTNGSAVVETWLQVSRNNGFTDLLFNSSTGTATVRALTDLAPGKSYWARARARNAAGWSGWSAVIGATMLAFATAAPSISDTAPDAATVNWVAPTGGTPTRYEVQVARDAAFTVGSQLLTSATWATTRRVTGLTPGATYYARVRSGTVGGFGSWSTPTAFVASAYATATPVISEISTDSATVSWSAPVGATPTGYELQLARDIAFTVGLQAFANTTWATTRRLLGLAPATRYYVRVRSSTSTGFGSWSPPAAFDTGSGAKIRRNGVWVNALVMVRVGGVWKSAKVWKRVNGQWVL